MSFSRVMSKRDRQHLSDPFRHNKRSQDVLLFIYVHLTLRIIHGLLFIGAGITKFVFFGDFIQSVSEFGIVLDQTVSIFAVAICVAEIAGGLGLMFHIRGYSCVYGCVGLLFLRCIGLRQVSWAGYRLQGVLVLRFMSTF